MAVSPAHTRRRAPLAAFDVGYIQPKVRECDAGEVATLEVLYDLVQRIAEAQDLGCAHEVDVHPRRRTLDLPSRHTACHHLRHRSDEGPVNPRVADEQVLGGVAAAPKLGYAQVDGADTRRELAPAIAVSLIAVGACVLGLRVHGLVDERLGHDPDERLDVDHPVVKSRHLACLRHVVL